MAIERTLAIIKPDAMEAGLADTILSRIEEENFSIIAQKHLHPQKDLMEQFYAEHSKRSFFEDLTTFMSSGNVLLLVLERENAILHWREVMGATDPKNAAEGTLRKLFGESIDHNAVHGSDSTTSATREIALFFPELS